MTRKTYLCIHGHFYQPPRENPWIEEIEAQDHVGPYHDWNERISFECYRPNALARILDSDQRIEDIVNNFDDISFNIGPTLLSWLEEYDKRTYDRIIEADKNSVKDHNGHGNAIAQVYNHIIMPLATKQEKITQVKWGVVDFKKRFEREPEGIWLPETACNDESLEVLVSEGLRFVILAPHQAEKIKRISDSHWVDITAGNIDPTRPYRYFLNDGSGKFIDIFFYDGPVSKAVAFDDLVNDAQIYVSRLDKARNPFRQHTELIHVATDGETYGHHKLYGDRALAYLLKMEAPKRGFIITNYGEFLANFPPEYEVKIKSGENHLGTSWSCPHGVKRWMEHCGCRGGGPAHWRQDWRKPLREAFDWLRNELSLIFVNEGGRYLKDVWSARNDYIHLILDRSEKSRWRFFETHAKRSLSQEETVTCLKLLEMQRSAMLMYTSCGWFFTEISGEETVQVIKYAIRAVQLAESITTRDLMPPFLKWLKKAKSNIEYFQDGEGVYEHLIKPSVVTLEKVVAHFAISSLFHEYKERFSIYSYEFENLDYRKESHGDLTLCVGHLKVRSIITLEELEAVFVLLQSELYDFYCYVQPFRNISDYRSLTQKLSDAFHRGDRNDMGKLIYDQFGNEYFSLTDLFKEEKKHILEFLSKEVVERFKEAYNDIYQKHRRMIDVYRMARIPLPDEYRFAIEHKLSDDFNHLVNEEIFLHSEIFDKAYALRVMAKELGLKLNKAPSEQFLTKRLNKKITSLHDKWDDEIAEHCTHLVRVAERLGVDVDLHVAQECYLMIVDKLLEDKAYVASAGIQSLMDFIDLGYKLAIDVDKFRDNLQKLMPTLALSTHKPQRISR